jgi:hypothetical protein
MNYEVLVKDFAERTMANLKTIERMHQDGRPVFETTQLINSCLGLLVFPQQTYVDSIPKLSLMECKS